MALSPRLRPNLRVIEGGGSSVLEDRRVVVDFTRLRKVVGIIDFQDRPDQGSPAGPTRQ